MKKILLLCAMCAFTLSSLAQYDFSLKTAEGATLYYKITKDPYGQYDKTGVILGEVTVVPESENQNGGMYYNRPYNTFGYHLVIPDTVSYAGANYIVTAIGNYAFEANNNYYAHSVIIPRTVKTIGDWAFYNALPNETGVTAAITIPENVTSIGRYAFQSCDKLDVTWLAKKCEVAPTSFTGALNTILFGTNVEEVPANLCYENRNLNAVTLPYAIKKVGDYAFYNCTELSKLAIGESVEYIGRLAFAGCTSLSEIVSAAPVPPVAEPYTFIDVPLDVKIQVPCGKIAAYAQAPEWSYFWYMAETIIYKATVLVEDYEQGNASVDYDCDSATFTAKANAGYKFKGWSNGLTDNPLVMPMTGNITLTALFEADTQDIDAIQDGKETPVKIIENGQVYILRNGVRYTMMGEKVN